MREENCSIMGYLEENSIELLEYFKECKKESKSPNYSEFCRKYLNGETKEGIAFNSIKIKRREMTEYIRNKYKLWCGLQQLD